MAVMAEKNELAHRESHDDEKAVGASSGSPPRSLEEEHIPWTFTRCVAIFSLCVVYVGSQVILYFISAGLTDISADLNTSIGNWMVTANTLAVAAICPFVGYITDLVGRRWICLGGSVLLIIASAIMGTAHSLGQAVAAQAIGGIGAGICELTAIAGVAEITPVKWRGVTLSIVTFSIVPFMPQLLYYILIRRSSWRWCFLLCGIWNVVGIIGLFFCYFPPPRHNVGNLTKMDIVRRIDYIGAFLSIVGVTLFLVGLQAGGYQYPWTDGRTLGPLIVGGLMIIGFGLWEAFGWHPYPMVPAAIFKGQRVVLVAFILVFIAGMDFYSILGFFPIVLERVFNTSDITVGVRALTYPWAILGGACIYSAAISYTRGHVRLLFLSGAVIMTAFTGALAASTPDNPEYTLAMVTLAAFGNGAVVVPALTLALYACPDEYIGTTGALSLSSRFLGGSVGTSIYFNVFNTQISDKLPTYIATYAINAGLNPANAVEFVGAVVTKNMEALGQLTGGNLAILGAAQLGAQWAFADSLKWVWITTIPFGAISCLVCIFLPNIKQFMVNRVAVDIH